MYAIARPLAVVGDTVEQLICVNVSLFVEFCSSVVATFSTIASFGSIVRTVEHCALISATDA